ncbi:MAG: hypothetical protein KDA80_13145 [Planctomycetaceae bacterium]|nr:hypothetical protein [Planctomycetaceae bacterium]
MPRPVEQPLQHYQISSLGCVLRFLLCVCGIAFSQFVFANDGLTDLIVPPSPFEEALETPEAGPFPQDEFLAPIGDLEAGSPGTESDIPLVYPARPFVEPSPAAFPSDCFRGEDRLGAIYYEWIGDGQIYRDSAVGSVLAVNGVFNWLARVDAMLGCCRDDCWVACGGHTVRPFWCKLQCKFVNWRHGSTYLHGCMPEGYSLSRFIRSVKHVEFHGEPLFAGGDAEPGGSWAEAERIDGEESRPLSTISVNIAPPPGAIPNDTAKARFETIEERTHLPGGHRNWCGATYYWNASLLNHQPLYFEDVNLERHGFSHGPIWQPVLSGARFFGTLPALPYLMTAQPPHTTRYTLGESRPGSHAPYVFELPPLNFDAAAVQAATVVGLIYLLP